jgi:hypothetical protein
MEVQMDRRLSLLFAATMGLCVLSACHSKLLGNNDDDNPSSAAPAPAPAPGTTSQFNVYGQDSGYEMVTDSNAGFLRDGPVNDPMHFDEHTDPTLPAGAQKYIHCHLEHVTGHIRFSVDKNGTGHTVDLSHQTGIHFMIRLDHKYLPGDHFWLYFEDATAEKMIEFPNVPGINLDTLAWQTLELPMSSLSGLDLTKMKTIFGVHSTAAELTDENNHSHCDFANVYYKGS